MSPRFHRTPDRENVPWQFEFASAAPAARMRRRSASSSPIRRGRRAHGIHGELVMEPLTDVPDAVFAPGRRVFAGTVDGAPAPDGRALIVEESRPFKGGGWIIAFHGIADRNEAERWRERYVLA